MSTTLYVESALSFGVEQYEGLWKIQYLHPLDANLKQQAWVPMTADHEQIGQEVANIPVAEPGPKLIEVMGWLYNQITRYPYYWPKEGSYVDKFGYDFEVQLASDNKTSLIEITQVAYEIMKAELNIKPPVEQNDREVDIQYETVDGGGVLIKLSVTLDRAQPVSELSLAPFTKYPMELVSIMYEEDIETFHPKKEIIIPKDDTETKKFSQTTESIRFQFPVVTAKRITLVLRQQNAEKNTYLVHEDSVGKAQLWADISKREAEVTLDTTDGLETVAQSEVNKLSGWDIYANQLQKHMRELMKWKKEFDLYKQKQSERNAKLAEGKAEEIRYNKALSEYRQEYNRAVAKYKTRVRNYQAEMQAYNTAYTKYQKDLVVYNKYLRDYAAWKAKWD
jgi:hypothetical protein